MDSKDRNADPNEVCLWFHDTDRMKKPLETHDEQRVSFIGFVQILGRAKLDVRERNKNTKAADGSKKYQLWQKKI